LGNALSDPDDAVFRQRRSEHWYLLGIGVDPRRQGQGIGSHLLQPVFHSADAAGYCCCLETPKASNVTFYRRHGFEVVSDTDPLDGGPHTWQMARPPRKVSVRL
jgi:ribosomal protein S18 acetylase RimI-like enzyme